MHSNYVFLIVFISLYSHLIQNKHGSKKIKTYTEQDLLQAIASIKDGLHSKSAASRQWNIPRSTLHDAIKERYAHRKHTPGK